VRLVGYLKRNIHHSNVKTSNLLLQTQVLGNINSRIQNYISKKHLSITLPCNSWAFLS